MDGQKDPVNAKIYESVRQSKIFTPSNEYFGFDGLRHETKRAVIIYQLGLNPELSGIRSASAVEYRPLGKLSMS
jgi:hypothetical protein